ncbi:MAG: hypothetical protein KA713_19990 [Chryseotalea sp. WA131a]|jgi:hypothetical protein|nr:MAG: hypothetical protein KA713_19990 [Chryseotalea sp. WA131a]
MESHKRVVGILYIVTGILQFIGMLLLSVLISSLIPFIADSAEENTRWVFEWIVPFINIIVAIIIVLFSIPSIIGGGALLQGKSWALTLVLILGCFKLFSFPIGTAIGIYTIWVYAEDKKSVSEKTA